MTRDTAGNTGGGGARGPRRPSDRRRPRAADDPAGEDPWATGLTGPQRVFPAWDGVPGYEFEGRRRPPPESAGRAGRAGTEPPVPQWPGPQDDPRPFRYTPMVSQPLSVPPPAWPRDQPSAAGFEFDTPHPAAPQPPAPPQRKRQDPRPRPPAPPGTGARAEWVRLLSSFLPEPVKRNWFAEFRSALHFRGAAVRVLIPILAMMVFGVAVAVIAGANQSNVGPDPARAPLPSALGFAPATLAGDQFTAANTGRGIDQTLNRVTSDGDEIVAVGSQQGARISRAQFFVSTNDGRSWSMGHVQTPSGGPPPPGYAPQFVAGGNGAWIATGPRSIWTSPNGRTWTLSSTAGLPLQPGDQISVLKRTAAGFIAVGSNVPDGNQANSTPVVFLSANGTSWTRLGAAQLKLAAGTGRVLDIRYAAAYGSQILIAGDVLGTQVTGKPRHTVTVQTSAAWLSGNGGTTWTLAVPPGVAPAGHGARAQISGEAVASGGFILVRPGTAGRKAAADVYRSANGTAWTYEATLSTSAGFAPGMINGDPDGAVIAGQSGPALIAFTSADGASWHQMPAFGTAATQDVSGVATAQGGTVVTAGTATNDPDSRQPLLTVLTAQAAPRQVQIAAIPGAADPELAVSDVAAGNGMQVAVGSANGYPAAWLSANGGSSWTRAAGQTPAVLGRPGVQQLTSVAFGPDGWLAVGGVVAAAAPHPVVIGSGNGSSWVAADGEPAFSQPGLVTEQAAAQPPTAQAGTAAQAGSIKTTAGYVIVGYQQVAGRTVAAAWWSAGLTGFQRATDASPGALDGPGGGRRMLAVTAGPHGYVAVGAAGNEPAAWTSADGGRTWTMANVPLPVGATRAVLQHVASNGRIVVAVGTATSADQQLPFAASSADGGRTWTEAALPVPAGTAQVTALTQAGTGFLAAGMFGQSPGHQDVVVWTSAGGMSWKAATPSGQGLAGTGIQDITGLDVSGRTMTGVGFTATPGGEQPVFWQSPVR